MKASRNKDGGCPVDERTHGRKKYVLLVDDDVPSLLSVYRLFISMGHTAIPFRDPWEALELFRIQPGKFDMIVTDLMMPGMNGDELATSAHRLRADIPIIICSGSECNLHTLEGSDPGMIEYVAKPFSRTRLEEAVDRLMPSGNGLEDSR